MTISEEFTLVTDGSKRAKPIKYTINKNDCWIQHSHFIDSKGYGRMEKIYRDVKYQIMHRYVYAFFVGELLESEKLKHICDNSGCINPQHLTKDLKFYYDTNYAGKKFGRTKILEYNKSLSLILDDIVFDCLCDCGSIYNPRLKVLKRGVNPSCGCFQKERVSETFIKHGLRNTRIYKIYYGIKQRCYNKNNPRYYDYGGRGIKMFDDWHEDFLLFYNWAMDNGYNDNLTIERVDVNGDYHPSNCCWITNAEQQLNKRTSFLVTYKDEEQSLLKLLRKLNRESDYSKIVHQVKNKGLSFEDALNLVI